MTEIKETEIITMTNELEDLRIPAYSDHLWFRCPKTLRDHFDTKRKGVFEISPPCFNWNVMDKKIEFIFQWGTDFANIDTPLNSHDIEEHIWVPSLKGLKYLHPSRVFNKVMKHEYPGLWMNQHFNHEWEDSGDVITLTISWDLEKYEKLEPDEIKPKGL